MFATRRSWLRVCSLAFFLFMTANMLYAAEYTVDPEYVFTPKGFDDDDRAELVLDGWKQSSCDTVEPRLTIAEAQRTISVDLFSRSPNDGTICMPVMSRFTVTASLGVLAAGSYRIVINNGVLVESLLIDEAPSGGPVEADIARINQVEVEFVPDLSPEVSEGTRVGARLMGRWSAVLFGEYTDSCRTISRVDTLTDESGRAISLVPVLLRTQGENGTPESCQPTREPFMTRVPLRDFNEVGRYLIHVRSQGGETLNEVFSVGDLDLVGRDGH